MNSPHFLIILRGNSGSGKSTVARKLQKRMGYGTALIEQDYIRRILLREKNGPNQPNVELIYQTASFALQYYNVILEGLLITKHYKDMLYRLISENKAQVRIYYFDIPIEETIRRHSTKPNAHEFGETELREWFLPYDVLGVEDERIVHVESTCRQTIDRILSDINE